MPAGPAVKTRLRVAGGVAEDAGTELLSDWGRVWREKRAKMRLAASTLHRYEQVWDLWVLPYLGEYELREIDVGVADDYVADLHDAGCGLETQRNALYLLQAGAGLRGAA